MKNITQERLIELAEETSLLTADERRLLESNDSLRAEYQELRALFSDLRAQPEPELDARAIAGILPGVRAKIDERAERRGLFGWLTAWQPAGNLIAAAASMIILLGLLILAPGTGPLPTDQELLSYGIASAQLADPSLDVGILQLEAGNSSDFELFSDLEDTLETTESLEFLDENTFDLMDRATDLDDETYDSIKDSFAAIM